MRVILLFILLCLSLVGCTVKQQPSVAVASQLAQGQRDFDEGYYKRALERLLPIACEGHAEAQYAIGYMYYYGYGVTQDSKVGIIWIQAAAAKHYQPAVNAMKLIKL